MVALRRAARLTAATGLLLTAVLAAAGEPALPDSIVELLSAAPLPEKAVDPTGRYLLLVHERGLQTERMLMAPTLEVAGVRINPHTNARHGALPYFGLTLVDLHTGLTQRVKLPPNLTIGFPQWAPDGSQFAFTATVDRGVELWSVSPERPRTPRRLLGATLSAANGAPCDWLPDSEGLLCQAVARRQQARAPRSAAHRLLAPTTAPPAAGSSEALAEHYLRSQLVVVDAAAATEPRPVGEPALFEGVDPSPSGDYILVTRRMPPYTGASLLDTGGRAYEVWSASGVVVHALPGGQNLPRALHWQPSAPATLVWAERRDGEEHIVTQAAPFGRPAEPLFASGGRFSGLQWLQDSERALYAEYEPGDRVTRVWLLDASRLPNPPRMLGARGDGSALGWPVLAQDRTGRSVVRFHDGHIYFSGRESTEDGSRAYLDRMRLDAPAFERVWHSSSSGREELLELLTGDARTILTRVENVTEPPNYVLRNLRAGTERRLTDYRHPVPELAAIQRVPLRYRRGDGVEMSSLLYLPAGAREGEPLPMVMWAYPREYREGTVPAAATRAKKFADVERALQLFFLLRGYAVLDNVSMPIVGGGGEANDTFVQQIVANAHAAVQAAAATGAVDPERVAVAGHSYGAFMVANLLAHSRLFKAGVGLSGAYNRTLTPFGFQTERRTLWEATDTYLAMSPLLYSHRIEAPLLLVHGLLDDNAGTLPIQSQYMYDAVRRTGGRAELLLLPHEGHSYRGRESVLATASAMLQLFDTHLRAAGSGGVRVDLAQAPIAAAPR